MNKMQVPSSVKQLRFNKKYNLVGELGTAASLEYIVSNIKSIVSSEKYILQRNLLVLNVSPECEKLRLKNALNTFLEGKNKVLKLTSSNRKPVSRNFKNIRGSTKCYKRVCILMENPFDLSLFFGGDNA